MSTAIRLTAERISIFKIDTGALKGCWRSENLPEPKLRTRRAENRVEFEKEQRRRSDRARCRNVEKAADLKFNLTSPIRFSRRGRILNVQRNVVGTHISKCISIPAINCIGLTNAPRFLLASYVCRASPRRLKVARARCSLGARAAEGPLGKRGSR
jgi:hypothetical protein